MTTIRTLATSNPGKNVVAGLLRTTDVMPGCIGGVGNSSDKVQVRLEQAPNSTLRVDCAAGLELSVTNNNGKCLQVVYPNSLKLTVGGNRAVVIYNHIAPLVVNMSGSGTAPLNNLVIVRLSQLRNTYPEMAPQPITGRLQYTLPKGAAGVIVHGCDATKVPCSVTDKAGKPACRAIESCVSPAAFAQANMITAIASADPCKAP